MDQWIWIAIVAVGGMVLTAVMQTLLGSLIRYLLFVGLAAAIMKWQNPALEGYSFLKDLETLQDLAVIGGLGFVTTLITMTIFFRRSRLRPLLYPLVGFGATFAAYAFWPYIVEALGS